MKKDYSSYDGAKTSRLLVSELFYIEADRLSIMYLEDDYSGFVDNFDGMNFENNHSTKTRIYVNVHKLVKLFEGGHRIQMVYHDDISNLYNLISRHLHNVDVALNKRVHKLEAGSALEGLELLGMLADEVASNNKRFFNKEEYDRIKEQENFFKPMGISSNILSAKYKDINGRRVMNNNNALTQHDVVLKKAKESILELY